MEVPPDRIVAEIRYCPDKKCFKARVLGWPENECYSATVKRVGGRHVRSAKKSGEFSCLVTFCAEWETCSQ